MRGGPDELWPRQKCGPPADSSVRDGVPRGYIVSWWRDPYQNFTLSGSKRALDMIRATSAGAASCLAVLCLLVAVNATVAAQEPKTKPKDAAETSAVAAPESPLPAAVREMVEGLRAAVQSGAIEDLRVALDWNELPPTVAGETVDDPIAYWKELSGDGEGREILAILGKLLDSRHTRLSIGKDPENSWVFVWPRLAELSLDKLTPGEEVELYRLVSPADARAMREKKKWTWYRLAIGADGTWHSFMRHE